MISIEDLSRCIELLSDLNVSANPREKKKLLEIGYILKTELDNVSAWNKAMESGRKRGISISDIDVKKLIEDNTQLFNENRKLLEINSKLKGQISEIIPTFERHMHTVSEEIDEVNKKLANLS